MMLLSAGLEGQRPGENIAAAAVCPVRKDLPTAWANSRIRGMDLPGEGLDIRHVTRYV